MKHAGMTVFLVLALVLTLVAAQAAVQAATTLEFATSAGRLTIHPVGHGSLYFTFNGLVIHVDPYSGAGDYSTLPNADQIWITHDHGDHLDLQAIAQVATPETVIIADGASAGRINRPNVIALANGQTIERGGVRIQAVPAYNLVQERAPGVKYHPKGMYNGYIASFGDFRVYVAGDTECIPEMREFGPIDVAFIPINLPFTMPPEEAVGCIKVIAPKIVVPYHQGNSDPKVVADRLKGSGIEVIVLPLP